MMKPMIGVMPIYDMKAGNPWMLEDYFDGIIENGGLPVMLPVTADRELVRQAVKRLDGFLFTGGDDVDPYIYQQELTYSKDVYRKKDQMESWYIEEIINADKPYLGICRGLQILNAALGGTLYQDLDREWSGDKPNNHRQDEPRNQAVHPVRIEPDSILFSIIGTDSYNVNSLHHQGICRPAEKLKVTARSDDGLIEGMEYPGKRFCLAVQWHPELLFRTEEASVRMFAEFVRVCGGPGFKQEG